MMNRGIMFVCLVASIVSGCGSNEEVKVEVPKAESKPAVEKTPSPRNNEYDKVAVRIDGRDITRGEIIRNAKVVLHLNMNKARKTKIANREIKAMEKYCRSAVNREIGRAAVEKYVADKGLKVSDEVLKRATRAFEWQYGAMSRKLRRMHKINDLKYMLGKNAFRADEMVREMALYEVMTNDVISTASIDVTDEMVNTRIRQIQEGNQRVAATNAYIFAQATNVWQQVVANEITFDEAAQKYSEDEYISDGSSWGCFTRDQLESDPEVLKLLPTIKDGDITPPIESDGGVAILRKDEDDNDKTYSFSRIFFRMPYYFDEETPGIARERIVNDRKTRLVQDAIKEYSSKLKVEYPSGTNLVWKLTAQDFK